LISVIQPGENAGLCPCARGGCVHVAISPEALSRADEINFRRDLIASWAFFTSRTATEINEQIRELTGPRLFDKGYLSPCAGVSLAGHVELLGSMADHLRARVCHANTRPFGERPGAAALHGPAGPGPRAPPAPDPPLGAVIRKRGP
jgi:hypothetical protein